MFVLITLIETSRGNIFALRSPLTSPFPVPTSPETQVKDKEPQPALRINRLRVDPGPTPNRVIQKPTNQEKKEETRHIFFSCRAASPGKV